MKSKTSDERRNVENFAKNLQQKEKPESKTAHNLSKTISNTFNNIMYWENCNLFIFNQSKKEKETFKITYEPNSFFSVRQLVVSLYSHFSPNPLITNGEEDSNKINTVFQRMSFYLNGVYADTDLNGWVLTNPNPAMQEKISSKLRLGNWK